MLAQHCERFVHCIEHSVVVGGGGGVGGGGVTWDNFGTGVRASLRC